MTWLETLVCAVVVYCAGALLGRDYDWQLFTGTEVLTTSIAAVVSDRTIEFAGVSMRQQDFIVMLILTAVSSLVAAGARFKNFAAGAFNWFLGLFFGVIFAHVIVAVWRLDPATMFGLAPSIALIAAKLARIFIYDDSVVAAIFGALKHVFKK